MGMRGKHAAICKVYDRRKKMVFSGTAIQIAHHFHVTRSTVYGCLSRSGRMLWECEIVKTNEKEGMPK